MSWIARLRTVSSEAGNTHFHLNVSGITEQPSFVKYEVLSSSHNQSVSDECMTLMNWCIICYTFHMLWIRALKSVKMLLPSAWWLPFYRASACNAMHGIAVTILSVSQMRVLWRNKIIVSQYLNTMWNRDTSSLSTPTTVAGNCPFPPEIFAKSDPSRLKCSVENCTVSFSDVGTAHCSRTVSLHWLNTCNFLLEHNLQSLIVIMCLTLTATSCRLIICHAVAHCVVVFASGRSRCQLSEWAESLAEDNWQAFICRRLDQQH